jgi:tetratricopeptide (TPR) repeat protein
MTETSTLFALAVRQSPSNTDKLARITALEALILSDKNNPSLHVRLAMAYLEVGLFDEAIKKFERCYKLNIRNTKGSKPETRINSTVRAATTAGTIGQHFLNHSQNTLNTSPENTSPEQAEEYWRKGMEWKKQEYRLITTLINRDPSKKHDLAMIAGKIGQEYLNASHRLREANPKQANEYWLNGMKWKEKSWHFYEELSWTDPSTLENCTKTAGYIGQEYLDASKRVHTINPDQAQKYWQEGMKWKKEAYTSNEELSRTDPSKKQNCALTAAQLGEEFANQEHFGEAIEWYEKALQHDPDNESIDRACKGLRMKMALKELIHEGGRSS